MTGTSVGARSALWAKPIVLALAGDADTTIRLLRGAGGGGVDVILLGPSIADVGHLTVAVRVLSSIRSRFGITIAEQRRIKVSGAQIPSSLPSSWQIYAQRKLDDLRSAQSRSVPGVGEVQAITIQELSR